MENIANDYQYHFVSNMLIYLMIDQKPSIYHTLGHYENLDSKILPNRNTLLRINLDISCLKIL